MNKLKPPQVLLVQRNCLTQVACTYIIHPDNEMPHTGSSLYDRLGICHIATGEKTKFWYNRC